MTTTRLRNETRILALLGAVLLVVLTLPTSVRASHAFIEISIPVDTVVRAPEGTTTELADADVPAEFAHHFCMVTAHAENQESVHLGNDLLVRSGTSQVVLPDVESEPGGVVEAAELLELGDVIVVSLIMGPDGVFSAGFEVTVECVPDESTTTTAAEVLPIVVTTTTVPEATTTSTAVSDIGLTTPDTPTTISIEDEVKGTEVLPFTGGEDTGLGLLGLALLAAGALLVIGTRRVDD
jgi:hypothetical protein